APAGRPALPVFGEDVRADRGRRHGLRRLRRRGVVEELGAPTRGEQQQRARAPHAQRSDSTLSSGDEVFASTFAPRAPIIGSSTSSEPATKSASSPSLSSIFASVLPCSSIFTRSELWPCT